MHEERDMQAAQPMAKIYAAAFAGEMRDFIAIFHRWIQEKRTDELLIDVHDYSHVHEGPGIILVGHECIYAMDSGEGRLGLSYKRRRGGAVSAQTGWLEVTRRAAQAARWLEDEAKGLSFATSEILLGFDDRLNAPGEPETFARLRPALAEVGARIHPSEVAFEDASEPRGPFRARLAGPGGSLADLLARLEAKA